MRYRILHDPQRGFFAQYRKFIFWAPVLSAHNEYQVSYFKTVREAEDDLFKVLNETDTKPHSQILVVKTGKYLG